MVDIREIRLTDVVEGVREGGAGGRDLKSGDSVPEKLGSTFNVEPVFSTPGAVPARLGGGSGGGFEAVIDDEDDDGCVF